MNIKMHSLLALCLFLLYNYSPAQTIPEIAPLSTTLIPDSLQHKADAIVRFDTTDIFIQANNKVGYKQAYAITVLNEKGKTFASLWASYSLLISINKIKGSLWDKDGKKIKNLKEKEIIDLSTYGMSYTFYSDVRSKRHAFNYNQYPYTVVYEIDQTIKTTFFLPKYDPQRGNNCAVEKARLTVRNDNKVPLRYKAYHLPSNTIYHTTTEETCTIQSWTMQGIKAIEQQPFSETETYSSPTIVFSPTQDFSLMEHNGSMASWNSLGAFIFELNKERDALPEEKRKQVHTLIQDTDDMLVKVQKLYKHMQQTTRYVSNQYGISGWQTFDAEHVAKNGYGDCKGLTNYLKALLKEAGINSYAALVHADETGSDLPDESFPANNFNHMILCIPHNTDSIWVECTSDVFEAGYLGSFTQGRKVLLITAEGGFLCQTPDYNKGFNSVIRRFSFNLDTTQNAQKILMNNTYSGVMQDGLCQLLKMQTTGKVREYLNTNLPFPSYSVSDFSYNHTQRNYIPNIDEQVTLTASGLVNTSGKRTFINFGWLKNPMIEIYQTMPRTAPFVLHTSFKMTDSILLQLPEGCTIESFPQSMQVNHPFAHYQLKFERTGDQVKLTRHFEQLKGIYDASEFGKYQSLYQTMKDESARLLLVLLRKTS